MPTSYQNHWSLNRDIDFLNHGSFGATPTVVLEAQREWSDRLERDPISFLAPERTLLPKLDLVRNRMSQLVGARAQDLAFVRNATEGVNCVMRSFLFKSGDEILITNHGYNACSNAVRFAAERAGATVAVAEIPFPIRSNAQIIESILARISRNTRLMLIDHVTSPSGLVLPVKEIVALAHDRGIRVMIDGAHAPGMLPIDLERINADYYTANHHKWLCGPKTSGFLHVRQALQNEVRPTTISHGANTKQLGDSAFLAEFNWVGTYDPTPLLAMPTAIDFLSELKGGGLTQLMRENRALALAGRKQILNSLELPSPAPEEMIGSLCSIPLPINSVSTQSEVVAMQQRIYNEHRIEVPIFLLDGSLPCIRISAQVYNNLDQYKRLATVLCDELGR